MVKKLYNVLKYVYKEERMDINKTVIKMWHKILLAVFLTFCLPPAMVLAGDTREIKPETLTVDGATVFTKDETGTVTMGTTSGAGWQYIWFPMC